MDDLRDLASSLHKENYADADVIFLAGSVIRGEGTKTSDLDIVVVYEALPNAYRESYKYGDWPVEAFVHDPQTLEYFICNVDTPSGVPSLASMVSEGIELPSPTRLSQHLKNLANETLLTGPPLWSSKDVDSSRYLISDLIEDLKEPRTLGEIHAISAQLYNAISNHYFRSQGFWSAKGKAIPRRLLKFDGAFSARFEAAFSSAFVHHQTDDLITLAAEVLSAIGGFLFEGHKLEAPKDWRIG